MNENEIFEDVATLVLVLWSFAALTFKISIVFFIVIFLIIFCCPWIFKIYTKQMKKSCEK